MKNAIKYWAPLYLYAALIFFTSSLSGPLPKLDVPQLDKLIHLIEYAIFGLLASRAFRNSYRQAFLKNYKILAILLALVYGISDEFHQLFVPGRDFSIFDMVFDGIGGMLGAFVYSARLKRNL